MSAICRSALEIVALRAMGSGMPFWCACIVTPAREIVEMTGLAWGRHALDDTHPAGDHPVTRDCAHRSMGRRARRNDIAAASETAQGNYRPGRACALHEPGPMPGRRNLNRFLRRTGRVPGPFV